MRAGMTSPSSRLEIVAAAAPVRLGSFAQDVRTGLNATPKRLPSKYFYDEVGSALFDTITLLPEYYLTRAETEILREWGWEMVRAIGNPIEFVELGSGSAVKTRILIEEALRVQGSLRYSPIDISAEALKSSAQALVASYPALHVTAYANDYFSLLRGGSLRRGERVLAMFMGSNIGNYEPGDAAQLLSAIAQSLRPGDGLLLGADLKKDAKTLERAYNDPAGVTTAFNMNLLCRINRELGGSFDTADFRHVCEYEPESGAVRSYLQAEREHTVRIEDAGFTASFARGERIHTESSYKFSVADIQAMGAKAGLRLERTWTDARERFSVNLFVV